jgi:hypothetical protein
LTAELVLQTRAAELADQLGLWRLDMRGGLASGLVLADQ